ncbi:helix-turn-helix transcriptional regulator [Nonomuraea soli]|uniref:AraC-like DNA-binding protein n=1 Tax=Nonomuraea soli TaxID=1032476 RepID=A0A7W0CN71_9ACTN|nr:AraC family transcriptional regulator [Nonomuraea soli]MBA2894289.1 AraC-like DNA-binding protein [Nonomuraea soli]
MTVAPGRLLFGGRIGPADLHVHYAAQLLVGSGLVLHDADGAEVRCDAALIPPNVPHAIVADEGEGLLALVDPASGRVPRSSSGAGSWPLDLRAPANDLAALQAVVTGVFGPAGPGPRHPALVAAIAALPGLLHERVRLADVARLAGVSQSRLSHLFTEELGLPFRPYVLWARLHRALASLAEGFSLTEAAHAAGFSDAAHMTRTFRRMMGSPPSALAAGVRWLQ